MYKFWQVPDKYPTLTECIIVISYTVKNRNEPTKMTKASIEKAASLYKKFPNAFIIMATGDNQGLGISNSKIMADFAFHLGVPKGKIIEEDKSMNTYENLYFAKSIIDMRGFRNPTIVAYDLHMRRVSYLAQKAGYKKFYYVSSYSKGDLGFGLRYLFTKLRITILIYEIVAFTYNLLQNLA